MLYSLSLSSESTQNVVGQFGMNSIRMKCNLGLAGKAFSSGKIIIDADAAASGSRLIAEEKDLTKLKLRAVGNAIAVPVLDKQNGTPVAVVMAYNYDSAVLAEQNLQEGKEQRLLWDVSSLVSAVLFNVDNLQGLMAENDVMAAQFNCVNEGVMLLSADLSITKINKSAEVLLNAASATAVGKHITEALGPANSHLMKPISE